VGVCYSGLRHEISSVFLHKSSVSFSPKLYGLFSLHFDLTPILCDGTVMLPYVVPASSYIQCSNLLKLGSVGEAEGLQGMTVINSDNDHVGSSSPSSTRL